MNANNRHVFEYVATLNETNTLEQAVNDVLDKQRGSMNLLHRQVRASQVIRENGEDFPVIVRLEYLPSEDEVNKRERVSMFVCTYDEIEGNLLRICNNFIFDRKMIVAVKYRLFLDAQRNREVNAIVAVFYEILNDKIAS
ncbi:hypothetical protein CVU83_02540 [Candidatus Falkowbacteria bacterium HGW-Falkowbacteria-2]|uniref:Uncharacterized protein n=1 Tax=Candidatus Falkowbacteria bacterium HGW-Falkowbacteria-2 TaxID=2013769 RepID=A0A2N2DZ81_9BACT|nr:MAG: hypothetical protein CVU83_02540 [Candidatus Falkowbacteria bacterium HGW-Falkowbacteria-2]